MLRTLPNSRVDFYKVRDNITNLQKNRALFFLPSDLQHPEYQQYKRSQKFIFSPA